MVAPRVGSGQCQGRRCHHMAGHGLEVGFHEDRPQGGVGLPEIVDEGAFQRQRASPRARDARAGDQRRGTQTRTRGLRDRQGRFRIAPRCRWFVPVLLQGVSGCRYGSDQRFRRRGEKRRVLQDLHRGAGDLAESEGPDQGYPGLDLDPELQPRARFQAGDRFVREGRVRSAGRYDPLVEGLDPRRACEDDLHAAPGYSAHRHDAALEGWCGHDPVDGQGRSPGWGEDADRLRDRGIASRFGLAQGDAERKA